MRKADALVLTVLIMLLIVTPLKAQNEGNDVHLFQSYFYDALIAEAGYEQGGLLFVDYDYANSFNFGSRKSCHDQRQNRSVQNNHYFPSVEFQSQSYWFQFQ